jgi:hypothetical protein
MGTLLRQDYRWLEQWLNIYRIISQRKIHNESKRSSYSTIVCFPVLSNKNDMHTYFTTPTFFILILTITNKTTRNRWLMLLLNNCAFIIENRRVSCIWMNIYFLSLTFFLCNLCLSISSEILEGIAYWAKISSYSDHSDSDQSRNNIGNIYYHLDHHDLALECLNLSLKISKISISFMKISVSFK